MTSQCIQCGKCCKHFSFFSHVRQVEWTAIVERVNEERDGILIVQYVSKNIGGLIPRMYLPRAEDMEPASTAWPFKMTTETFVSCPFFQFDIHHGLHYCSIHDIKPRTCREFTCSQPSPGYGTVPEYCIHCWIEGFKPNRFPSDCLDGSFPCEKGHGCPDLPHRLRWFLAYAARHPSDPRNPRAAVRLLEIVDLFISTVSNTIQPGIRSSLGDSFARECTWDLPDLRNALACLKNKQDLPEDHGSAGLRQRK
ncbi:hypothetical protein GF325_06785 [Candidatus Bathyarchaeota archaeon]|nr:hypothetical protein [Candidatus Bathyarchaeota archaeon]